MHALSFVKNPRCKGNMKISWHNRVTHQGAKKAIKEASSEKTDQLPGIFS
jgi:hypothetical protein